MGCRMLSVDLNCDMGESFGPWSMGQDEAIMPYISSANIACGFHAGDPGTMRRTVALAIEHGVVIGAHPGLPDREGFGRRAMRVSAAEVYDMVVVQIGSLAAVAASQGATLHHVKAHGALYHQTAHDAELADALARAVRDVDDRLLLLAQAGSIQVEVARERGLKVGEEAFADRSYQEDGSLTPRQLPGAMIEEIDRAVVQALGLIRDHAVQTVSGASLTLNTDTLCIHGDQPQALAFAQGLSAALIGHGIRIQALG